MFQDVSPGEVDEKVLCIIRDMVDPSCIKHTMNLPGYTSVQLFLNDVARKFSYVIGTISVHYEKQIEGGQIQEVTIS